MKRSRFLASVAAVTFAIGGLAVAQEVTTASKQSPIRRIRLRGRSPAPVVTCTATAPPRTLGLRSPIPMLHKTWWNTADESPGGEMGVTTGRDSHHGGGDGR